MAKFVYADDRRNILVSEGDVLIYKGPTNSFYTHGKKYPTSTYKYGLCVHEDTGEARDVETLDATEWVLARRQLNR